MTINQLVHKAIKFTTDNSPLILTSVGAVGALTTAVLTGKACWMASRIVFEAENEPEVHPNGYEARMVEIKQLTVFEKAKLVWPLFIPPLAVAAVTVTSIVMANRIGTRRAAAMAAAFSLSEKAFEEYRDKVVERVGKKDEREIREEISQERVDRAVAKPQQILIANEGDVPCYDQYSQREFFSTKQKIDDAVNQINYHITHNGYASLNDFYSLIELEITKFGEDLGWTSMDLMEITYTSVVGRNDRPTLVINFPFEPIRNYDKVHG